MRLPASKIGIVKKADPEKAPQDPAMSAVVDEAKRALVAVREAASSESASVEALTKAIEKIDARIKRLEETVSELSKPRAFTVEHERDARGYLTVSRFQQVVRKKLN